jgi:ADP-heptose:LPS heptosyltransferase
MLIGFNRCGGLGDGIVATATVAGIREKFPNSTIVGYVYGSPYTIFKGNDDIDRLEESICIDSPPRLKEDIIREKYPWDIWFDLKPVPRVFFKDQFLEYETDKIKIWRNELSDLDSWYIESCRELTRFGLTQTELLSEAVDVNLHSPKWKYQRRKETYITLCNEAWGTAPIKTYPYWEFVVNKLKDHKIIQLGEFKQPTIGHCTNISGDTNLNEACNVMAGTRLHLGIEGFWNHFCETLDIPRVIVYGPTPHSLFSYNSPVEEKIFNGKCQDCWWKTNDWFLKCPEGFDYGNRPCMQDLEYKILDAIGRL